MNRNLTYNCDTFCVISLGAPDRGACIAMRRGPQSGREFASIALGPRLRSVRVGKSAHEARGQFDTTSGRCSDSNSNSKAFRRVYAGRDLSPCGCGCLRSYVTFSNVRRISLCVLGGCIFSLRICYHISCIHV